MWETSKCERYIIVISQHWNPKIVIVVTLSSLVVTTISGALCYMSGLWALHWYHNTLTSRSYLNARLWYLHYLRTGDTTVLHYACFPEISSEPVQTRWRCCALTPGSIPTSATTHRTVTPPRSTTWPTSIPHRFPLTRTRSPTAHRMETVYWAPTRWRSWEGPWITCRLCRRSQYGSSWVLRFLVRSWRWLFPWKTSWYHIRFLCREAIGHTVLSPKTVMRKFEYMVHASSKLARRWFRQWRGTEQESKPLPEPMLT